MRLKFKTEKGAGEMGADNVIIKWKRSNNGEVENGTVPAVLSSFKLVNHSYVQGYDYRVELKKGTFSLMIRHYCELVACPLLLIDMVDQTNAPTPLIEKI